MSIPVCKFYSLNQTCRFGKHCRYLHSVSQRPPPSSKLAEKENEEFVKDTTSSLASTSLSDKKKSVDQNEEAVSTESTFSDRNSPHANQARRQDATPVKNPVRQDRRPVCHYFAAYGNCRYGNECRFSHEAADRSHNYRYNNFSGRKQRNYGGAEKPPRFHKAQEEPQSMSVNSDKHGNENVRSHCEPTDKEVGPATKKESLSQEKGPRKYQTRLRSRAERRVCPFFKSGRCNRGERCRFLHPRHLSRAGNETPGEGQNEQGGAAGSGRTPFPRPTGLKQIFTYAELDEADPIKVRESEVSTMKRRFPKEKFIVTEESDKFSARISFVPTDPDWPFDIKVFDLLFTVPPDYPKEMMIIQLPTDQDLPETVRRYVEVSIKEWLDHKTEQLAQAGRVELIFRPFLRWLDKSIEEITTEALKQLKRELVARAAGMEFIPAERLQAKFRAKSESSGGEDKTNSEEDSNDDESDEDEEADTSEEEDSEDEDSSDDGENSGTAQSLDLDPEKKGTEISLRHLQLRENASALLFERVKLVIQCSRCKNHADLSVQQGRVMSLRCEKCNQNQFVNYRAALVHQFSSVVGYLDVDGCQAFDLVLQDSRACVTCMACSKQTRLDGLVTGQMVDGWCQACNAKFKLATEAVKFAHLVPSGIDTSVNKVVEVASTKAKKAPKDPAIKEGCPLPEFGTCKHYKHSYRWLRFPCCGKAYPCDVCHDKKENHEMVLANRMICGHCCKEQNFAATRPCNACGQHLTKIRSAHWEGGSGCRDKITMSKNDIQKYKNMNKTTSNHKKKVQGGASKKKTTKLRHA